MDRVYRRAATRGAVHAPHVMVLRGWGGASPVAPRKEESMRRYGPKRRSSRERAESGHSSHSMRRAFTLWRSLHVEPRVLHTEIGIAG